MRTILNTGMLFTLLSMLPYGGRAVLAAGSDALDDSQMVTLVGSAATCRNCHTDSGSFDECFHTDPNEPTNCQTSECIHDRRIQL